MSVVVNSIVDFHAYCHYSLCKLNKFKFGIVIDDVRRFCWNMCLKKNQIIALN